MDEVRELAERERPKLIFCGGTAIPRTHRLRQRSPRSPARSDAVLVADIAHIAGLVAGGAHPSPVGHAAVISTTTHKTLRGPRGAMMMCDERARQGDRPRRLPRPPGRPAQPHDRGHRGRAQGGRRPTTSRRTRTQIVANAKALAAALARARLRPGVRRHRQPPDARRPDQQGHRRQAGRAGARPGRHRAQLQHGALRPAQAVRPVRHPARHAVGHDARG